MSLFADDLGSLEPFRGPSREETRARLMGASMPTSPWRSPDFRDLSQATMIAADVESHDPELHTRGPGFVRGQANVIGLAMAAVFRDGARWSGYFPLAHDTDSSLNMDAGRVWSWAREQLGRAGQPKVAANGLYDMEATWVDSSKVGAPAAWAGQIFDVQNAEPLLDENSLEGYSLEVLSRSYLGRGKTESLLHKVAPLYGVAVKNADKILDPVKRAAAVNENERAIKRNLKKFSPKYVGPYAEDDCLLAIDVFLKQKERLEKEDLWKVFLKETALVPLLLKMRLKGVPVDVRRAEELRDKLVKDEAELQRRLNAAVGMRLDVWKPLALRQACLKNNVEFEKTAVWNKSLDDHNPSFTQDWIKSRPEPWLKVVGEIRKISKMRRDFVEGVILEMSVRGRLHCQFHQLRGDEEGTRSGRFSSTHPNLQQIPARDEIYGPLIRGLFVAAAGLRWGCWDLTGQEPRWTVHYANLCGFPGAAEAVHKYNTDPRTDYHQWTADMCGITRKAAKFINLGLAYGMGRRKLACQLGYITEKQIFDLSVPVPPEVDDIMHKYHAGVPFVRKLQEACSAQAEKNHFVRTFWGRKRHFDRYERARRKGEGRDGMAMTLEQFKAVYPNERPVVAFTHKALNCVIQGSSADHIKQIMLDLYLAGFVLPLTVHDEVDEPEVESQKKFDEVTEIIVNAVKLCVPVVVDAQMANSWGECK